MLDSNVDAFRDKSVGLALIASPSYGARLATTLKFLSAFYGNDLGKGLEWGSWGLDDLDKRFRLLLEERRIPRLFGAEAYENRFIVHSKRFPLFKRTRVVEKEAAARYFAPARQLPDTDHFTSVKPTDADHPAHQFLTTFLMNFEHKEKVWAVDSKSTKSESEAGSSDVVLVHDRAADEVALRITRSLEDRGLRVWSTSRDLRPGASPNKALGQSLAGTKAVILLWNAGGEVPESVIRHQEVVKAASQRGLHAITAVLPGATTPSSTGSVVMVDDGDGFEPSCDKLVWPGVTGQHVIFVPVGDVWSADWRAFRSAGETLGLRIREGDDIDRVRNQIDRLGRDTRLVLVLDIFEGRPNNRGFVRNNTGEYLAFIERYREQTRGRPEEIVFLLYHDSRAWASITEPERPKAYDWSISEGAAQSVWRRAREHYFTLHRDLPANELATELAAVWRRMQRELLKRWRT